MGVTFFQFSCSGCRIWSEMQQIYIFPQLHSLLPDKDLLVGHKICFALKEWELENNPVLSEHLSWHSDIRCSSLLRFLKTVVAMLKPWFGIHQLRPHFFSALIFMSVDSILINNIFNKALQINYLAASSFCSKGEKVTHEEQLVFYTCSALFKITYFLPDQWAAFSTPLHGKAHFHVPVVLWGRWLHSPVLPSLVLKAGELGGGSSVFPALGRDNKP